LKTLNEVFCFLVTRRNTLERHIANCVRNSDNESLQVARGGLLEIDYAIKECFGAGSEDLIPAPENILAEESAEKLPECVEPVQLHIE